jgi:hypothetical protein
VTAADACWLLMGFGGFFVSVSVAIHVPDAIRAVRDVHLARSKRT